MFISQLEAERKSVLVMGISDLGVSFLCWAFSAIYIACGHGKTSVGMVCLLVPFFVSGMTALILSFSKAYRAVTLGVRCLWNLSMASFTVGMALVGVFEIAGVPNSILLIPIWLGGVLAALCAIVIFAFNIIKNREKI